MTVEFSVILIIGCLLAAGLGYMAAVLGGRKKQIETEQALQQAVLAAEQSQHTLVDRDARYNELHNQHHTLQLDNRTLLAEHDALKNNYAALEKKTLTVSEQLSEAVNARHVAETASQVAQTGLAENKKAQQELQDRFTHLQTKFEALQAEHTQLTAAYTKLHTSLEERDNSHAQQLAQFDQQKQALSEQFKLLANDILEVKTKALQDNNSMTLSAVMAPFQQSIDHFKREVQEIHHRETTQQGELRKELDLLKQLNQQMTTEAHELSTALRGQKKLQGNWGELILENVLERSGLQLGKDYKREVSINTEDGRQRPDVIVYLPQGKHLIIDAKVSLNAYTRYINSAVDAERSHSLSEHVKAIGQRITELADRDYYKLPGLNSPEIVFMFIPIEAAFVEALKADESLFQQAIEKNVLVATPTTLLTSLNIVKQLWRYEDQNKHTAALANKAESVFKKLNAFLDSFEGIKKGLEKATEAYTKAESQLVSGKGNLVKQVGEFKNLAPAIKAELPEYFTEKAALEIDYIPIAQQLPGDLEDIPA